MKISSERRWHVVIILAIYIICFGAYALVDVPYWDDWVILQNGQQGLWEMFQQLGRREQFPLVAPFALYTPPVIWAIASFICWGVVPVSIYGVLRHLRLAPINAMWTGVLTAATPLNEARFALAMLPYAFSAAFFSFGLYLVANSVRFRLFIPRISAAILLFFSFPTNSFLTIAWLAPLIVFIASFQENPDMGILGGAKSVIKRFELILLPLIYWAIKAIFQPAYGLYDGYNQFQMGPLEALILSALRLPSQAPDFAAFFPTTNYLIEALACSAIVVTGLLLVANLIKMQLNPEKLSARASWLAVAVLLAASIFAIFPYTIVGIRPSFMALWDTRHQTTLSLVVGALIFFTLLVMLPSRLIVWSIIGIMIIFVSLDVSASRQLLTDVRTTKGLLYSPQIAKIPSGTMLGMFEVDRSHRMFSRSFQFYDASSVVNASRGAKDLIMLSQHEAIDPSTGLLAAAGSDVFPQAVENICRSIVSRPQYGFGDFISNGWFADIKLRRKSSPRSFAFAVAYAFWGLFDPASENNRAVADLDISISPRPYIEPLCSDRCCSRKADDVDWDGALGESLAQ